MPDELRSLGHDRANEEGSEKCVDSDCFRRIRRGQDQQENDRDNVLRQLPLPVVNDFQTTQHGLDEKKHRQHINRGTDGGPRGTPDPTVTLLDPHDRDDECQHAPGDDIVERGAGDRHRAERGFLKIPLGQNPRQHRKRGDAHRGSHEQRRREKPRCLDIEQLGAV